jgi:hypothetical protein
LAKTQLFKIKMRVACIAALSLLFLASFAQAVSATNADDSPRVHGGERLSYEDVDLMANELNDDIDVSDEEDEHDVSDLSEADIANLEEEENEEFRVHGNYCGPGWCAGKEIQEHECGKKTKWMVKWTDSVDRCCFHHDKCCGTKSTRSRLCNKEFISCLKRTTCNDSKSSWCNGAKGLMEGFMETRENSVCGEKM